MYSAAVSVSCVRELASAYAFALAAAAPLLAQEGAVESIDLRPLAKANERFEVSEKSRWSDELVRLRLLSGEEVLLDVGASATASGTALGLQRMLRVERTFEDAIEAVSESAGAFEITRLARTWKQLEATLRVDESGAERGRRVRRFETPLAGRTASLARGEGGVVTASLRPRQATPGQEPPPEPAPADLALCTLQARCEPCLPAQPVAIGGTWAIPPEGVRALLGSLDGFPFPRAEGYPGGIAEEARQADPLAVFLARGALAANARLEASDESTATIAIELTVDLDGAELYRSQSADAATAEKSGVVGEQGEQRKEGEPGEQGEKTEDQAAAGASAATSVQALPWSGRLQARGRLVFDRTRRQVQSCALTGEFELRLEAKGAEGPAQVRLELATKGSLERNVRIFAVSS